MKSYATAAILGLAIALTGTVQAFASNSYAESVWKILMQTGG